MVLTPAPSEAKKKENKQAAAAFAVIGGTTFRPPGLSLPGAKVRVVPEKDEAGGVRLRPAETVSDGRGEFAIRVPVVPMKWAVDVSANGYQPQSKTVTVEGEQRLELSFILEPGGK